jgi:hypothetical protein
MPIQRLSVFILAALLCLAPLGVLAVLKLPIGTAGAHDWLPDGRRARQQYSRFCRLFGGDQALMVSWDGASLDDPRLQQWVEKLGPEVAKGQYYEAVVSPADVIADLENTGQPMQRGDSMKRLRGVLLGDDGTAALVILFTEEGVRDHTRSIQRLRELADLVPGLGSDQLRMVGAVHESYAIDVAAAHCLDSLVLPSTVLALSVCLGCIRSLAASAVVMLLAATGQVIAVSFVYYGGYQFNAVLIVLPTLIFMLTLSGAVHLVNYHLENPCGNSLIALRRGWWPCTLSSLTTMLGMGSLAASELAPVRQFGWMSAVCLGLATFVLLLAFPAALDLARWVQQRLGQSLGTRASNAASTSPPRFLKVPVQAIQSYSEWLGCHANAVAIGSLLLLGLAFLGLSRLTSSIKFVDMFPPGSAHRQDMNWFEERVGPIGTLEILLGYPNNTESSALQQARQVAKLAGELIQNEDVGAVYSAATFFPDFSDARGIRASMVRAMQNRRIADSLDELQEKGLVHRGPDGTTWRVSAHVSAVSPQSYGQMTESVSRSVHQILQGMKPMPTIELTGVAPVIHETQVTLLSDLGYSFLSAFLLITPVMMATVRSLGGGFLVMLPNVLPVTMVFGSMGWLGASLDIAGILTASIALGIAVDDTLHFVCWYISELRQGHTRQEAVCRTFQACSTAMIHTTLISCCAMVPFLFAEFTPTQQFAKLMICMLSLAIVGDLFLLPALLLSRAGPVVGSVVGTRVGSSTL